MSKSKEESRTERIARKTEELQAKIEEMKKRMRSDD